MATTLLGKEFITESDQMRAIVYNPEQVTSKLNNRLFWAQSQT